MSSHLLVLGARADVILHHACPVAPALGPGLRNITDPLGYRRIQVVLEPRGVRADGPRSAPSCVTWGYRLRNRGRRSEPRCWLRIWMSDRTYSGGTSPLTNLDVGGAETLPTSGRGLGLSILRPFWTAAPRRSRVTLWPTTCTPL